MDHVQESLEETLRPWIAKKMQEYLGEENPGMVEYVLNKLTARIAPQALVTSLAGALDREAESFVQKLWRMVVFESERARILASD